MGRLATSKYIYDTFSLGTNSSRFPTKSEIVNLGLTVSGSYSNTQLVQESHISNPQISYEYLQIYFSWVWTNCEISEDTMSDLRIEGDVSIYDPAGDNPIVTSTTVDYNNVYNIQDFAYQSPKWENLLDIPIIEGSNNLLAGEYWRLGFTAQWPVYWRSGRYKVDIYNSYNDDSPILMYSFIIENGLVGALHHCFDMDMSLDEDYQQVFYIQIQVTVL